MFILILAGCAEFPALDDSITDAARDAPYPTLQPLPGIADQPKTADTTLDARIAALQDRAARLRRIDIAALQ
ncbi:MAG: hypothetical protein AAFP85_05510 [Pseudomonadota bacterium]